jgi:hypothetical protein
MKNLFKCRKLLLLTSLTSLFTLLLSCAPQPPSFNPMIESQPYVVSLKPEPYQLLDTLDGMEITFSHPLDPNTISEETVYIASGEVDKKDVKKEEIPKVSGQFETSNDLQTLRWHSQENLNPGDYSLVVTSGLQAADHSPFNQNPGQDPEAFIAIFHVAGNDSNSSSPDFSLPSSHFPASPLHRPSFLVIHEVLYDAAGSDTDGNEFIELYGTPETDIDRYQIVIINGGDGEIIDTLTLPTGSKIPEDGIFLIADSKTNANRLSNILGFDHIDNFDPQNGPDAIQLLDEQGHLLDTLCYGESNLPLARNGLETCEGSAAVDVSSGHSLSRVNGADTQSNADDFVDLSSPTPGVL